MFSKENQPANRGRKPTPIEIKKVAINISVSPEVKDWYGRRKGLAGTVLEQYMKEKQR